MKSKSQENQWADFKVMFEGQELTLDNKQESQSINTGQ